MDGRNPQQSLSPGVIRVNFKKSSPDLHAIHAISRMNRTILPGEGHPF